MTETTPVIDLEGLEVTLGKRRILHGLTAKLTGRSIGLLGPNGAGKTTLLHTLLGFYAPSAGTARLLGHDIRSKGRDIRALMGYMPENDAFIAGLSGVRFVRLMAELSGLPPEQALERAHEALFYVGLGEARYRPVDSYSLGMKQLAKLAQSLVHGPKVLFLDEPTNGLDPPARARMLHLIRDIRDAGQVRVILSSHLLRDVEECCEEVLVLKNGQIATYCNLEAERSANRSFLELELRAENGNEQLFRAALNGLGCEVAEGSRRRIKLVLPEGVEVRALYQAAVDHSVQIRHLDYRRDSLEDIFLKAMEG
ncbi:MAG TPA: ABC transporter ATP-binding protein [Thermoanaerobaculia bacterium]|jgi:ABC-2 type transport system ATP-binding protein|nr:ABC transporter ATP-binding protein [Thermoanaerobaculia bacterium]